MKITSSHQRNDPALAPDEIELSAATLAQEPCRISKSNAVPALAQAAAELDAFVRESAERRAGLERQRAAAVEIQAQFTELTTERDNLPNRIAHAKREMETCLSRLAFLDEYVATNWEAGLPLHDHVYEHVRQKHLVDRIPGFIDSFQARLVALDAEIATFKKTHNIQ